MGQYRWLAQAINHINLLAKEGKVEITYKALRELAQLELGLDEADLCEILSEITSSQFKHRRQSKITHEWLYVFNVVIYETRVYLKVVIRKNCVVISFHEDEV